MIKFLSFGDTHYYHKPPYSSRTGDYLTQILRKTEEIIEIANAEKVDAILFRGDLFHEPQPEYEVLNKVMDMWDKFTVPVFACAGNHCLLGSNIESLESTGLGSMQKAGRLSVLMGKDDVRMFTKNGVTVQITGIPSSPTAGPTDLAVNKSPKADLAINIVHQMLLPGTYSDKIGFISMDEVAANTEAEITLCGHNHAGTNPILVNSRLILCDGSVARVRMPEKHLTPKVTIITVDKNSYDYRYILLKSVPYSDSLFIDTKAARTDYTSGSVFARSRSDFAVSTDINSLLERNAKRLDLTHVLPDAVTMFENYKLKHTESNSHANS